MLVHFLRKKCVVYRGERLELLLAGRTSSLVNLNVKVNLFVSNKYKLHV